MLEAKLFGADNEQNRARDSAAGGESSAWMAPTSRSSLHANVTLPGSKSLTNRELILAALADGPSTLTGALRSRDSSLMIEALRALDVEIELLETSTSANVDVRVTPAEELTGSTTIACGLAGTVMRFMPPVAALALGPTAFDGDPYARKRPMRPVLDALRHLGADISDDGRGALPFTVHGTGSLRGGRVEIDASQSSQFVSGLLLAAARFEHGVHVVHTGEHLPSLPHIEMTLETLRHRGVQADSPAPGEWRVLPGRIRAIDVTIEPDLSNAAPFLAAALVSGGSVSVPNWPTNTTQVGDQLRHLLPQFGGSCSFENGVLTVSGEGRLRGASLHLPEAGELAPTLVALAALAAHGTGSGDGEPSTITGIGHIRHHETDRIAALVSEINKLGGDARELADGIEIRPATLTGAVWHTYEDHRMATSAALIGLRVPGITVDDITCTAKTLPSFTSLWSQMLGLETQTAGAV